MPICLRRTRKLLNLPEPSLIQHAIEFSDSESQHYRSIMEYCRRAIDAAVSGRTAYRTRHTMLQSILQLRIFCNNGTFMPLARPDTDDALDPDEALALLQQEAQARCVGCQNQVFLLGQSTDSGSDSAVMLSCAHVFCRPCFAESTIDGEGEYRCERCDQLVKLAPLQPFQQIEHQSHEHNHSSKLARLVDELAASQGQEKR